MDEPPDLILRWKVVKLKYGAAIIQIRGGR
jgi:hypothetical protein